MNNNNECIIKKYWTKYRTKWLKRFNLIAWKSVLIIKLIKCIYFLRLRCFKNGPINEPDTFKQILSLGLIVRL